MKTDKLNRLIKERDMLQAELDRLRPKVAAKPRVSMTSVGYHTNDAFVYQMFTQEAPARPKPCYNMDNQSYTYDWT